MDGEPCYSLEVGYIQLKHKALSNYYAKFPIESSPLSSPRKRNDRKISNSIGGYGEARVFVTLYLVLKIVQILFLKLGSAIISILSPCNIKMWYTRLVNGRNEEEIQPKI